MKNLPEEFRYSSRYLKNVVVDFGLAGSMCHVGSLLNDKDEGQAQQFRAGPGRFTVDFNEPRAERKLFAAMTDNLPISILTRALANLIVGGLGQVPA